MRMLAYGAAVLIVLGVVWPGWSAETGADHLKPLGFLVGNWIGEYEISLDVKELGIESGAKVVTRYTSKMTFNGNVLETAASTTHDGKPIPDGTSLTCWDPDRKALVYTSYGEIGLSKGVWKQQGDVWALMWEIFTYDGNVYKGQSNHRVVNDDEFTWKVVNLTLNGEQRPDSPLVHFKRVRPPRDASQAWELWSNLLAGGVWVSEDDDGNKLEHSYRWRMKKRVLIQTRKGGDFPGISVVALDPEGDKLTWWAFVQDGAVGKAVVTKQPDGTWIMTDTGQGPQGEWTWKGRLTIVNQDEIKVDRLEAISYGKTLPPATNVWKREKE